jgi:outer membrane immunogenic protein
MLRKLDNGSVSVKALLLTATALVAASAAGAAGAADLPVKAPPMVPIVTPTYSWTGFYIGGNAGGAWGTFDPATTTVLSPTGYFITTDPAQIGAAGAKSIKSNGFAGGFDAGYNLQAGNIVLGLESDIESFHLNGSVTSGPVVYLSSPPTTFTLRSNADTNWLATARGRIGVAANNWLFFATGGIAFTNLSGNFAFSDTYAAAAESSSFSNTKIGYVVGGGVEAGLWGHWSLKAEYLYVNFGTVSATSTNLTSFPPLTAYPQNPFTHSIDLKANIARVGLNYRF